jgi:hypothetical protein
LADELIRFLFCHIKLETGQERVMCINAGFNLETKIAVAWDLFIFLLTLVLADQTRGTVRSEKLQIFVNQKQLILTIDIYGSIINIQTIPREIWKLLYTSLLQNWELQIQNSLPDFHWRREPIYNGISKLNLSRIPKTTVEI